MRYLASLFIVLVLCAGCAPTPNSPTADDNTSIAPEFKSNVSTIFGNGGKNTKDVNGFSMASNIIWKDSLGTIRSLDSLRGKIVLLNFWATWCPPCDSEMSALNAVSDEMQPDVNVIAVSVDKGASIFDRVKLFTESRKMKIQVIIDPPATSYFNYGGDVNIPWTFAIDRLGRIVHTFKGQQTKEQFMGILRQIP